MSYEASGAAWRALSLILLRGQVPSAVWDRRQRDLHWSRAGHDQGGRSLPEDEHVPRRLLVLQILVRRGVLMWHATQPVVDAGRQLQAHLLACP